MSNSKLPFHASPTDYGKAHDIGSADGSNVCLVNSKADAEFIVHACNLHHDMLESLMISMEYLCCLELEWVKKARATIAKAKGEAQ